jgi:hypothetical protein
MFQLINHPGVLGLVTFVALWGSARIGTRMHRGRRERPKGEDDDFRTVLAATLTLVGLLIGFAFSMAVSRYDLRKSYEAAEANAIGTEYVRADLLPAADAAKLRQLLKEYTAQRVLFYGRYDDQMFAQSAARRAEVQQQLWSAVSAATIDRSPFTALAVAGMNDVLNSQAYAQAAWLNRIPRAAWILLALVAALSNVMFGYGTSSSSADPKNRLLLVLPLVVSISFFLIADIDSPRGGIIRVSPENLLSVADGLR